MRRIVNAAEGLIHNPMVLMFRQTDTYHAFELAEWSKPTVTELLPYQASLVRKWFEDIDRGHIPNDPLSGLTPKQIFIDCVWASEESTAVKIMLLCIGRFLKPDATSSSMAYAQIARECGLHESTAKKVIKNVTDGWLRVGIGKGRLVPGKGRQNLYHGICPPETLERLRDQKRKGRDVVPDLRLADAAADRIVQTPGVASEYPETGLPPSTPPETGFAADDRGRLGFRPGSPQATRTPIDSNDDKKEEERAAPSQSLIVDETKIERCGSLHGEILPPSTMLVTSELVRSLHDAMLVWSPDPFRTRTGFAIEDTQGWLRDLVAILLKKDAQDVVEEAVSLALIEMAGRSFEKAAEKGNRQPMGFRNYFTKVVQSKLGEARKVELDRHTDAIAAEIRLSKHRQVAEIGVQAYSKACREGQHKRPAAPRNNGRHEPDESGRKRFVPDANLWTIGFNRISGVHGNMLLKVPGAQVEDVEEIMVEVSKPPKRKASRWASPGSSKDASLSDILDRATAALRLKVAYAKHGTPAKQCGGTPAKISTDLELNEDWIAISQQRFDEWQRLYPRSLAAVDDGESNWVRVSSLLGIWSNIVLFAAERWQQYGPGLQAESEAEFERALRERHDEAERAVAREAKWVAEQRLQQQRFLEGQAGAERADWQALSDDDRQDRVEQMREIFSRQPGGILHAMRNAGVSMPSLTEMSS